MRRLLTILTLFLLVNIKHAKPYYKIQGETVRVKRQQINAIPVRLHHGNIETKEGIIIVNKQGKRKKFNVVRVPILQDKKGVPFEITAKESGVSYLTGPALRILGPNNKYDATNPFIFFPVLNTDHSER